MLPVLTYLSSVEPNYGHIVYDLLSDQALLYITLGQDKLIELELRKLKITKKGILNIKSPRLEKLDFRGCGQLDNIGLLRIIVIYK